MATRYPGTESSALPGYKGETRVQEGGLRSQLAPCHGPAGTRPAVRAVARRLGLGWGDGCRVDGVSPAGGRSGPRGGAEPRFPLTARGRSPHSLAGAPHCAGPSTWDLVTAAVVPSLQVTRDSRTYSVGVCTAAAGLDQGGCKDGGVCLLSGSRGASFGRLASMKLDYRHQDEAVILSYANGDNCPPGKSAAGEFPIPGKRESRPGSGETTGERGSGERGALAWAPRHPSQQPRVCVGAQARELLVTLCPEGLVSPR